MLDLANAVNITTAGYTTVKDGVLLGCTTAIATVTVGGVQVGRSGNGEPLNSLWVDGISAGTLITATGNIDHISFVPYL